jgi:hypothetical protein
VDNFFSAPNCTTVNDSLFRVQSRKLLNNEEEAIHLNGNEIRDDNVTHFFNLNYSNFAAAAVAF